MNILVIPEDFRKDQYILKPLFSRLFKHLGAPNPRVEVCRDPLLGGIGEALKPAQLAVIVNDQRGMTDIFILCVDRDRNTGRRQRLDELEALFGAAFFAENAWEEIETWVLAGLDLPGDWRWADVRAAVDVKERYFGRWPRGAAWPARLEVDGRAWEQRHPVGFVPSAKSVPRTLIP